MRYLFTLLCEDIRREVGNKLTFIGVSAGGKLLVNKFPEAVRGLQLYQQWLLDPGDYRVKGELKSPSGKDLILQEVEQKISVPSDTAIVHLVAAGQNVDFEEPGRYTYKMTVKGTEQEASGTYVFDVAEKVKPQKVAPNN